MSNSKKVTDTIHDIHAQIDSQYKQTNLTSHNSYSNDVLFFGALLAPEKEEELYDRIRNGDDSARTELATHYVRLVLSISKKYLGRGIDAEDIIQEGNVGLCIAATKFDPNRAKFSTVATWWIRQGILRSLYEKKETMRIPTYLYEILSKIRPAIASLEKDKIPATYERIAEISGVKVDLVERAILAETNFVHSLDAALFKDDSGAEVTLKDIIADKGHSVEKTVINDEKTEVILDFIRTNTKSAREAQIIIETFGIGLPEKKTLEQVGDEFLITRERVRQIQAKILLRWQKLVSSPIEENRVMMQDLKEYLR